MRAIPACLRTGVLLCFHQSMHDLSFVTAIVNLLLHFAVTPAFQAAYLDCFTFLSNIFGFSFGVLN